jgi:hypothetical protein
MGAILTVAAFPSTAEAARQPRTATLTYIILFWLFISFVFLIGSKCVHCTNGEWWKVVGPTDILDVLLIIQMAVYVENLELFHATSFSIPQDQGSVHHELEIALLIAQPLAHANEQQVAKSIAGIGLGLDLTLRDVQDKLKEKGHPWERAKAFDGACPLTDFVSAADMSMSDWQALSLRLEKNTQLQHINSSFLVAGDFTSAYWQKKSLRQRGNLL